MVNFMSVGMGQGMATLALFLGASVMVSPDEISTGDGGLSSENALPVIKFVLPRRTRPSPGTV